MPYNFGKLTLNIKKEEGSNNSIFSLSDASGKIGDTLRQTETETKKIIDICISEQNEIVQAKALITLWKEMGNTATTLAIAIAKELELTNLLDELNERYSKIRSEMMQGNSSLSSAKSDVNDSSMGNNSINIIRNNPTIFRSSSPPAQSVSAPAAAASIDASESVQEQTEEKQSPTSNENMRRFTP